MRYPYEDEIEAIALKHFNLSWSFGAARRLPHAEHSRAIMAIRNLVYSAMSESFNRGIEFQKSGKTGMRPSTSTNALAEGTNAIAGGTTKRGLL